MTAAMRNLIVTHSPLTLSCTALALAMAAGVATADQVQGGTGNGSPRQQWHQDIGAQYAEFVAASDALGETADAFCSGQAPKGDLQEHWQDAYDAWQRVRFVDFGPIEVDSRAWQIQFWPDSKNLVGTRMASRLRQDTPLTQDDIAQAGVAEQGFPALEYLLFDDAMQDVALSAPVPCSLVGAIAAHLATTAAALESDWQAFASYYLATDAYTETSLHAAMQALETLEDKRLGEPLGMMGSNASFYRAEAWRSDASVTLAAASLEGMKRSFLPGLRVALAQAGQTPLAEAFAVQLDDTLEQARDIEGGIRSGLENAQQRQALGTLYLEVAQLSRLMSQDIGAALGVVRGFNSSDGD